MATTYSKITYDGKKVQVDSAIRDGNGKQIDTNYQEKLVSGTNIKTVNGNSLLGSGDITIQSGGSLNYITGVQLQDANLEVGDIVHFYEFNNDVASIEGSFIIREIVPQSTRIMYKIRGMCVKVGEGNGSAYIGKFDAGNNIGFTMDDKVNGRFTAMKLKVAHRIVGTNDETSTVTMNIKDSKCIIIKSS